MNRLTTRRGRLAVTAVATLGIAAVAAPAIGADGDNTRDARQAIQGGKARSVILFLGDGMGDSEITIARNYLKGAAGRLELDKLPLTGAYTTYAVQEDDPSKPDYVTDSAASGTGWATGRKTYNGAISVTPAGKQPLRTILELAQDAGYATGNITTARVTDATPAVLASHINDRGCEGPEDVAADCPAFLKENGGPGSIAEQEVEHDVDVLMGGGLDKFSQTIPGGRYRNLTVLQQAQVAGYQIVTDEAALNNAKAGEKVLGLFGKGTLPTRWGGPPAVPYVPGSESNNPIECAKPNPDLPAGQPSLEAMTSKAINLLNTKQLGNRKGFFLQVEGASIDKQDHAQNPCGQIGENADFDRSVAIGRRYALEHPDTLVIVTADHGHTSQITYNTQTDSDHSPGLLATLTTKDGVPMTLNYATNLQGRSQTHTGTQVRIAAQGPQAANVLGVTDQTELFTTMARAMRGIDLSKAGVIPAPHVGTAPQPQVARAPVGKASAPALPPAPAASLAPAAPVSHTG